MSASFNNLYAGKRVFITGHTGFKGSWLATWLVELGATVKGYSLEAPTEPSNFKVLNLEKKIEHVIGDVRDLENLKKEFNAFKPDVVFHLAAQAITRMAYEVPVETLTTNIVGTTNILECIRCSDSVQSAVMVTSDKCYQNVEWVWGYRENDRLGGDDPYSASKACAELVTHTYIKSFLSKDPIKKIASARAGNVIGGGDWAIDRIVPDCVRAFSCSEKLEVRNPYATRPWQHVLEPLSGYLWLAANLLMDNGKSVHQAFNFGPSGDESRNVGEVIDSFKNTWKGEWFTNADKAAELKKECNLLRLNCDKSQAYLGWSAALTFDQSVEMTAKWYKKYYENSEEMYQFTTNQIKEYVGFAKERHLSWCK